MAKRKSAAAEVAEIFFNSPLGQVLTEKARQLLGLSSSINISDRMRGDARKAGDIIREKMKDDPHKILGLDPSAPTEVVKAAYRSLVKKYHEKGTNPDEKMMKRVNGAYDAIMKERGEPK
jgi:DnaJ-domain-containing protein 1